MQTEEQKQILEVLERKKNGYKGCEKKTYNYILNCWGSCGDLFEDTREHPIKKVRLLCLKCSRKRPIINKG